MDGEFGKMIEKRRSYYEIKKESRISDKKIRDIFAHVIRYAPSPHNSQGSRVVLLLGNSHDEFWDMVMQAIRDTNPEADLSFSKAKIDGFRAGYGTALFYYDEKVTRALQEEMSLYSDVFPDWAKQENAMLQYAAWNMLEEAGFGVSLQHYNPIVDKYVYDRWPIDRDWKLIAQMPFGLPAGPPWVGKTFEPVEGRLKVYE